MKKFICSVFILIFFAVGVEANILTESGDSLVTESVDAICTEDTASSSGGSMSQGLGMGM